MKRAIVGVLLVAAFSAAAMAAGSGGTATTSADGLVKFAPPQAVSCIAVRVEVPGDRMVTGLKWYNGSGSVAFPRILVASGNGFEPPAYEQAVAVAQNVLGLDNAWSEVAFSDPIASQSGTLFILIEYPQNYEPAPGVPVLGVGYANEESDRHYFVTGNGTKWYKVTSRYRVLLEPFLAPRQPGVVALRGPQDAAGRGREGLFAAPNPFNPETRIELYLPAATTGTVRIMDIRGCQVAELHHGALAKGQNSFVWHGRDDGGRAVASGVYWVFAQTGDRNLVRKVLLVK